VCTFMLCCKPESQCRKQEYVFSQPLLDVVSSRAVDLPYKVTRDWPIPVIIGNESHLPLKEGATNFSY
jgi:hypothetical protein